MKSFLNATNSCGEEIFVDPNDVKVNPARTNMTVACYHEKDLDMGNREPKYENYHHIRFDPKDKEEMEKIFKLKAAEKKPKKRKIR